MEAFIPPLLGFATLLPLLSFFLILCIAARLPKPAVGGWIAVGAIVLSAVLSFGALTCWCIAHFPPPVEHHHDEHHAWEHACEYADDCAGKNVERKVFSDCRSGFARGRFTLR